MNKPTLTIPDWIVAYLAFVGLLIVLSLSSCGRAYFPPDTRIPLTQAQRESYAVVTRHTVRVFVGDTVYEYRRQSNVVVDPKR